MNTRILILLACMAGIMPLPSCRPHEEPVDYSLKTGNICCSDGSIVPPDVYEDGMGGIGVVVTVGGEDDGFGAIAVAREDIGRYAYADTLMDLETSGGFSLLNGKENTAVLVAGSIEEGAYHVPAAWAAFSYAAGRVTGWHLPSVGELREMVAQKKAVMHSLEIVGGEWLDEEEWYQSSSQDATSGETVLLYNMVVSPSGRVKASVKTESHPVRPFIVIQ